ncbi:glycosyltransferase family 4 protein [Caulobacter segnis]|uniref:glycosyltransferase family 4 protein n=1 Tax=Caulobacter segnis TaxID=88688 RepID=UPI00268CAF25|nr:glycosyltransferase family 4 protein [Caulobacter segnis]
MRGSSVLIVIQNMSFTFDTRMQNVVRTLVAHGHRVRVICPRYRGDPLRAERFGAEVHYYPVRFASGGVRAQLWEYATALASIAALMARLQAQERIAVIHLCNPPDILFPIALPFKALGARVIFDMHDLCPELGAARFGGRSWLRAVLHACEWASIRVADHVLAASPSGVARALARGRKPDEVTLVRNGLAAPLAPGAAAPPPRGRRTRIGYVGNINPQDGVAMLVEAAAHMVHVLGRDDVEVLCVGDGSALSAVRRLASDRRLGDSFVFTGRLPHDKAMALLADCDVCALPDGKNPFTDTCVMVKALEYAALGKAFACFDLRETRAVCAGAALVADGESPAALARALLALVDDPELRREREQAARALAPSLLWAASEPALLAAYARLAP